MQYEQLSFELFGKPKEKNIRDVKCKYKAPLRRYFCEDNWCADGCKDCENYKEHHLIWEDNMNVEYIDYLSFKSWLYYYYPQFIGKEVENDVWEYQKGKCKVRVSIKVYQNDNPHQFISVGYDLVDSGASFPCDTLEEVKMNIKNGLEKIERGNNDI